MRVFEAEALRRAFPAAAVVDAHAAISRMRLHKDAAEIAALRRAIAISETALAATLAAAAAGMSETGFRAGASSPRCSPPAPTASPSTRSCSPAPPPPTRTAAPSPERRLERGQPLLIDFGAAWGGYIADITRTFFVGSAAPEHRDIYEAVRAANALGREHRRAADDARHARPPRHRQPARLRLSPTSC